MKFFLKINAFLLLCLLTTNLAAQTTWLWAEAIDRYNTWNDPFYAPYNTADKLTSYQTDSLNYCKDCSLPNVLWSGIEANKIIPYQLDPKAKSGIQKIMPVKKQLLITSGDITTLASLKEYLALCEIIVYRRADTGNVQNISALPIEWITLNFRFLNDTLMIHLKSKECFSYLAAVAECRWVHPVNFHVTCSMKDALIQRQYIIRYFNIASPTNLKTLPSNIGLPALAETLKKNDTHTLTDKLEYNRDTLLIRLHAIYSADIRENFNRGFNKAHILEYLLKLHAENKIKGYAYHQEGYFTGMRPHNLFENLLMHHLEDGEVTYSRAPVSALTSLHIMKSYTKISGSNRIITDWIIFGLSKELSTTFENTYSIAFKFEDVLAALSATNLMWYNGKNQQDSARLDEALHRQYISFNEISIYSSYERLIATYTKETGIYKEVISQDQTAALFTEYTAPIVADLNEIQKRVQEKKSNQQITTYQLHYAFTSENNSALTKNTQITDALLDAIRTNKITVYKDEALTQSSTSASVLNKLDKTRFYKTGNARKDSIYISKIPVEDRFIKSSDLKEFTLSSNYTTIKKKTVNRGLAFGIFIPAEFNPQYETDTLCYVSFNEFVSFLQKNKAYKKLSLQFTSLLNERAIVSVEDFYDILLYDATDEEANILDDLPAFVREHIQK